MLNLGQYMEMAIKFKVAEAIMNDLPFFNSNSSSWYWLYRSNRSSRNTWFI